MSSQKSVVSLDVVTGGLLTYLRTQITVASERALMKAVAFNDMRTPHTHHPTHRAQFELLSNSSSRISDRMIMDKLRLISIRHLASAVDCSTVLICVRFVSKIAKRVRLFNFRKMLEYTVNFGLTATLQTHNLFFVNGMTFGPGD